MVLCDLEEEEEVVGVGCDESRRRPGPSRRGADPDDAGKFSGGTSSPGRSIKGEVMVSRIERGGLRSQEKNSLKMVVSRFSDLMLRKKRKMRHAYLLSPRDRLHN